MYRLQFYGFKLELDPKVSFVFITKGIEKTKTKRMREGKILTVIRMHVLRDKDWRWEKEMTVYKRQRTEKDLDKDSTVQVPQNHGFSSITTWQSRALPCCTPWQIPLIHQEKAPVVIFTHQYICFGTEITSLLALHCQFSAHIYIFIFFESITKLNFLEDKRDI